MRVLVVGGGGREHALAWKLSQEAEVFSAPGNPGIAQIAETFPVRADNEEGMVALCEQIAPEVVLVGPENPLLAGLGDRLRARGVSVFGPSAAAAALEGSKAWAKEQMLVAGVPTAHHQSFRDFDAAVAYAASRFDGGRQVAVKASGAALGKGVVVAQTHEEARDALEAMLVDREHGEAGATVVVEDALVGREFSLLALVSETEVRCLPVAQDYKRALDGDHGPNTGGMGSVSPVSWLTEPRLVADRGPRRARRKGSDRPDRSAPGRTGPRLSRMPVRWSPGRGWNSLLSRVQRALRRSRDAVDRSAARTGFCPGHSRRRRGPSNRSDRGDAGRGRFRCRGERRLSGNDRDRVSHRHRPNAGGRRDLPRRDGIARWVSRHRRRSRFCGERCRLDRRRRTGARVCRWRSGRVCGGLVSTRHWCLH